MAEPEPTMSETPTVDPTEEGACTDQTPSKVYTNTHWICYFLEEEEFHRARKTNIGDPAWWGCCSPRNTGFWTGISFETFWSAWSMGLVNGLAFGQWAWSAEPERKEWGCAIPAEILLRPSENHSSTAKQVYTTVWGCFEGWCLFCNLL